MIGKAGLMYTIGFGMVLTTIGTNLNRYAVEATGTMGAYYDATASHNIALAGANVGLSRLYQDTSWMGSISQTLSGSSMQGSFTAAMSNVGFERAMLRSVSSYSTWYAGTLHDTVEVYFDKRKKNSFALFAWLTNFEGNNFWVTNDTVWGRVHTNGIFHVNGKPVFTDKVTTSKRFDPKPGTGINKAIFKNSYETGVAEIQFPPDMSELINASNAGGRHYAGNIWVTLNSGAGSSGDGMAYVRQTETGPIIDSISLADPSFNGAILADGRANVKGYVDGKLTIGSMTDIYVQDDIRYETDPLVSGCDDVLGLVSNLSVYIAQNGANNSSCHVDAAIFARTGSFSAENASGRGLSGKLEVTGSITQQQRGDIASYSGGSVNSGFSQRYKYDTRFEDPNFRPPYFPGFYVKTYAITDWWESYRLPSVQ